MLELLEVEKVSGIVTATENNVATRGINAECSKHFLNFMIGPFLALTDINNTKKECGAIRLVPA
jgi:hypothetical protein